MKSEEKYKMREIKQIKKSNDPPNYKPKKYDDIVKIVMDSKAGSYIATSIYSGIVTTSLLAN